MNGPIKEEDPNLSINIDNEYGVEISGIARRNVSNNFKQRFKV